ncbi:hypothetical protein F5884DRAFT_687609, partial [Xylogone sp. PMI_703]
LLNRFPVTRVVAVCGTEPSELQWAQSEYKDWGINVYDDYSKMIQHPSLQAIWISISTDVHASLTIAAIQKGLHVFCEKPIMTKLKELTGLTIL